MPSFTYARDRANFELLHLGFEIDHPDYSKGNHPNVGYQPSYFYFNNTVLQFPWFKFSQEQPIFTQGDEKFCLHLFWKKRGREKNYSGF